MRYFFKLSVIVLLIFTVIPLIRSAPPTYLLTEKDFLYETWFKVEAVDLMNDGASQLVALGRDYTEARISAQLLALEQGKLISKWESPNLINEGPVVMGVGRPLSADQPMLIILSQECLYLYTYENQRITLSYQFKHSLSPHELSVADTDGDGLDELIVVRLGKRLATYDEKVVEVYRLTTEGLLKLGSSALLGNIRCLTGGDLDGDGYAEVVTDAGLSSKPGVITVLGWDPAKQELVIKSRAEQLLSTLPFGMTVAVGADGSLLYTADGWGRLNLFRLANNDLEAIVPHFSFPNGLVGVTTGDLNGDGQGEVIAVGYPNHLFVVTLI